jgi:hypothetical protein
VVRYTRTLELSSFSPMSSFWGCHKMTYCSEMRDTKTAMRERVKFPMCRFLPCMAIPLCGIDSLGRVRDAVDSNSWIVSYGLGQGSCSESLRKHFGGWLQGRGAERATPDPPSGPLLYLLCSLHNPRKKLSALWGLIPAPYC